MPPTLMHIRSRRWLTPASGPLRVSGALLAVTAQAYLTWTCEPEWRYAPETTPPALGAIALLVGCGLFAWGTALRSGPDEPPSPLARGNLPAPRRVAVPRHPLPLAGLACGVGLMGLLTWRLATGAHAGWDLPIWLLALGGCAAPFLRSLHLAAWRVALRARGPDIAFVLGLAGLFIALNVHDLRHWYYSFIGDEYGYYLLATEILEGGITRPFSQAGVWDHHPYLNSVYQAAVMGLFAPDHFGWKFGSVLSGALALPGLYALGRSLDGRKAAVVASLLFAFSHYIWAQAHGGFNNLHAVPVAVWALACFVWGQRRGSPGWLYAAGVVAGLGFYTHYAARTIAPILFLYGVTVYPPRAWLRLWPLVLGFALAVLPTLLVEGVSLFTRMFEQVAVTDPQTATIPVGARLGKNLLKNLLAFNYNTDIHTWVSGTLLDPVSAVLAVLGLGWALGRLRCPAPRLLLIWFAVALIATGVLSPSQLVAITRLYFAVPPLALLAGCLAARVGDRAFRSVPGARADGGPRSAWPIGAALLLGATVLGLNAWQFWQATPQVFRHEQEALAIGAMRTEACGGQPEAVMMMSPASPRRPHFPWFLEQALHSYYPDSPLPRRVTHAEAAVYHPDSARPWPVIHAEAAADRDGLAAPLRCVVFLDPDATEIQSFKQALAHRYPDGTFQAFTNPSAHNVVEIFGFKGATPDAFNMPQRAFPSLPAIEGDFAGLPLAQPRSIRVAADGRRVLTDSGNHRILVLDRDNELVLSLGDYCPLDSFAVSFCRDPDGAGPLEEGDGQFNEPWGAVRADSGLLYVADTWNHRIQVFDGDGRFVTKWGVYGQEDATPVPGAPAQFFGPHGVEMLPNGDVVVVDTGNHQLQAFSPEGVLQRGVGSRGDAPGRFNEPVDGRSHVETGLFLVTDTRNRRLQLLTLALQPRTDIKVLAGMWTSAEAVHKPYLAVVPDFGVVVSDPRNSRLVFFDLTDGQPLGVMDLAAPDTDAAVLPLGLAFDPLTAELLVVDGNNSRVLVFDLAQATAGWEP